MPGNYDEKETSPADTLASESGESLKIEKLPERLNRYANFHGRSLSMSEYIKEIYSGNVFLENEYSGVASRLESCGELLLFHNYFTVNQVRLSKANFCMNHLLCPMCGSRRGSKLTTAYWDRFQVIKAADSDIRAFFVTFTVKDGPDLPERFNHLSSSKKKYHEMRREVLRGKRKPLEINKALGGVGSYETKIGSGSGLWHVHDHNIWLCKEMPDKRVISGEWKDITGDSFIVDVRPIEDVTGFIEVMAYAVKFSTMTVEDNFEAYRFLRKKRLINSFGIFRGVEIPESLEDEPLEALPYIELLYAYIHGSGYKQQRDLRVTREKINAQINEGVPF